MNCWSLVNAVVAALSVRRFKRRSMYLLSICGMLAIYIALTVSAARYATTQATAAGIATVTVIFVYCKCQHLYLILDITDGSKHPSTIWPSSMTCHLIFCCHVPLTMLNSALTYTYLVEIFPYTIREAYIPRSYHFISLDFLTALIPQQEIESHAAHRYANVYVCNY